MRSNDVFWAAARLMMVWSVLLLALHSRTYAQVYERFVTFNDTTGKGPRASLLDGNDGNFYGTTEFGGRFNKGIVFRKTPAGVLTTLVDFTGDGASNRGSSPYGSLVLASDGNFYGTTHGGGASASGTIFKMTPAGVLTTLVEFTGSGGNNKGGGPAADLVEGSDGNFYGTTETGGTSDQGTVFKMSSTGELTTPVEFSSNGFPQSGPCTRIGSIRVAVKRRCNVWPTARISVLEFCAFATSASAQICERFVGFTDPIFLSGGSQR